MHMLFKKQQNAQKYLLQIIQIIPVRFGRTSGKLQRNISRQSDTLKAPHAQFVP